MYVDMVRSEYSQKGYARFLRELVNHEKDRASLGTVLILSALGVDREVLFEKYLD